MISTAYLALGSNLDGPETQIERGIEALARAGRVTAMSPVYRTSPVGYSDQPDFLNAAVELQTSLDAEQLLDAVKQIEHEAGRSEGGPRNGPRPLDIDILHIEGVRMATARLTLPHPRISERGFVLVPLADLRPDLVLAPGMPPISDLLARWRRDNRADRVERATEIRSCPTS